MGLEGDCARNAAVVFAYGPNHFHKFNIYIIYMYVRTYVYVY